MNRKDLLWFFVLEIFAIVWAGAVFQIFDKRLIAGALAGVFFVVSSSYMFYRVSQWPDRWKSVTLYPLSVHLFGISLPMVAIRFLNASLPFQAVRVWGLPGPVFHRLSTLVFAALVIATLVDLARVGLRDRTARKTSTRE